MAELQIIGATVIMNKEYKGIPFFIENLIPTVGIIILAGSPKIGKSWFVLQLLLSVCYKRETFIGHKILQQTKALYLSLEDNEARIQERIIKQGFFPTDDNLQFAFSWPANGTEIQNLEDFLKKNPEVKLICIDTKGKFTLGRNEESYQLDYDWMSKLKVLSDKYQVAIILVTHLRKRHADEDPYEQVSGSNGNTGAADTIIMIKRGRNQAKGNISLTSRDFAENEEDILFDTTSCSWFSATDNTNSLLTEERQAILDVMKILGNNCRPSQIAEELHKNPKNISNMLQKMKQYHLVQPGDSYGTYKISQENNEYREIV